MFVVVGEAEDEELFVDAGITYIDECEGAAILVFAGFYDTGLLAEA
ncbi:MAG: hypothetical protein U1C46_03900 [Bacteroidales bacterium]|nr:hypothetical protein [Bacteroidales bacterium]